MIQSLLNNIYSVRLYLIYLHFKTYIYTQTTCPRVRSLPLGVGQDVLGAGVQQPSIRGTEQTLTDPYIYTWQNYNTGCLKKKEISLKCPLLLKIHQKWKKLGCFGKFSINSAG